jgi:hypothetical protein
MVAIDNKGERNSSGENLMLLACLQASTPDLIRGSTLTASIPVSREKSNRRARQQTRMPFAAILTGV